MTTNESPRDSRLAWSPDELGAEIAALGMAGAAALHGPAAVAMFAATRRIAPAVPTVSDFRAIVERTAFAIGNYKLRRRMEHELGVSLPIDGALSAAMMAEVRRFKWIEAERAGRDIWRERDPRNPDTAALSEWFKNHFGAWYLYHSHRRASAQ